MVGGKREGSEGGIAVEEVGEEMGEEEGERELGLRLIAPGEGVSGRGESLGLRKGGVRVSSSPPEGVLRVLRGGPMVPSWLASHSWTVAVGSAAGLCWSWRTWDDPVSWSGVW